MSAYAPVYIADLRSGLVTNRQPFLLPQDAFPTFINAYLFRGRIVERQGLGFLGRLRRDLSMQNLGNTDGGGNFSGNIFTILGLAATEPNAEIVTTSITLPNGSITVGAQTFQEASPPDGTLVGDMGGTGTINYATGTLTLAGAAAATPVIITFSYYPGLPVMGLPNFEIPAINEEDTIGFDTKYAYRFSNFLNRWQEWIPGTTWNGNNSNFFWSLNYWQNAANDNLFWTTNFNAVDVVPVRDPIRYTNGAVWTNFAPLITAADTVYQCRCIIPFKGRLLFLNTFEGTTAGGIAAAIQFPQRCRFSANGDPLAANAWRQDIPGNGGFIDAPTNEHITGVTFLRDILVVRFERSTWQLRYTGNEILPFVFERINAELGSESTFSQIKMDAGDFSIGQRSINTSNGNTVSRIDLQIPDQVFDIQNTNNGTRRVYGIRDYRSELIYWTYPNADQVPTYPNRVLVYNYRENSYAQFIDSLTCYGYHQPSDDVRWQDLNRPTNTWEMTNRTWDSFAGQSFFQFVIAGNQQGFTFVIGEPEQTFNTASLHITAIVTADPISTITSPDHNLQAGDFVFITDILGTASVLNNQIFKVLTVTTNTFTIQTIGITPGLTYLGSGQITVLSNLNITSKKFHLLEQGIKVQMGFIDVLADVTETGQFTLDIFVDENNSEPANSIDFQSDTFFNSTVLTSIEPFQTAGQSKSWHRVYINCEGQFLQFRIRYTDDQMMDTAINASPVIIHAFILWIQKNGQLV